MATKPTIDEEAKRLDLAADQKELAKDFRRTRTTLFVAILAVAIVLVIVAVALRH